MGLLTLLRKLKKNDNEARVLVLGLDNAGKTTILKKLSDEVSNYLNSTFIPHFLSSHIYFDFRTSSTSRRHRASTLSHWYKMTLNLTCGTLEDRNPSDPTGETTSTRRMLSYMLSTAQIGGAWRRPVWSLVSFSRRKSFLTCRSSSSRTSRT